LNEVSDIIGPISWWQRISNIDYVPAQKKSFPYVAGAIIRKVSYFLIETKLTILKQ